MSLKFQRKIEDFVCENCGTHVEGDGYTDHCPRCLFGKHVDNFPGDRENPCQGILEPIDVEVGNDEKNIIFRCQKCGKTRKNKVASEDDSEKLAEVLRKKAERFWKE